MLCSLGVAPGLLVLLCGADGDTLTAEMHILGVMEDGGLATAEMCSRGRVVAA